MRSNQKRLLRAAEDLTRAAEGDLDSRDLDGVREHLADSLVLLEYRLRPKPAAGQLLGFAAGVAGLIGVGFLAWGYRRRLRRQLDELAQSAPHVRRAIVSGREAVTCAAPAAPRAANRAPGNLLGDSDRSAGESPDRA